MQERVSFNVETEDTVAVLKSYRADLANTPAPVILNQRALKAKAAEIIRAAAPHANRAERRAFLLDFARKAKAQKKATARLGKGA